MTGGSPPVRAARAPEQRGGRGAGAAVALLALGLAGACRPTRTLIVDSVPPGAVVRLDEQVIGRTPLEHRFQHYGERRLSLYLPGYLTYSERVHLRTPWYARFPLDLLTEVVVPLGLDHRLTLPVVTLAPDDGTEAEPAAEGFVTRAGEVRAEARRAADASRAARARATGEDPGIPAPPAPAPEAPAAEPPAPETQAPETQAPETQAPETQAPETPAPETPAPAAPAPAP